MACLLVGGACAIKGIYGYVDYQIKKWRLLNLAKQTLFARNSVNT